MKRKTPLAFTGTGNQVEVMEEGVAGFDDERAWMWASGTIGIWSSGQGAPAAS